MFILPVLLISLYFGGLRPDIEGMVRNVFQYLFIVAVIIVIKNTNPRVRIDQAVCFFWGPVTVMAIIAVVLAIRGF